MQPKHAEVTLSDHCEPPCGLGVAHYDCPHCNKYVTDYDLYPLIDNGDIAAGAQINCYSCFNPLILDF